MYLIRLASDSLYHHHDLAVCDDSALSPGDIINHHDTYRLAAWLSASYPEIYSMWPLDITWYQLIEKQVFPVISIELMHRMVAYYHSSYRQIIKLWMPSSLEQLLPYCTSVSKIKKKLTLTICPDTWTLAQYSPQISISKDKEILITSTSTIKTKLLLRSSLRKKNLNHIITTGAEVFYPRYGLSEIRIIAPERRSYQHQSDPRFHTYRIAKQMSIIYGCPLHILSIPTIR